MAYPVVVIKALGRLRVDGMALFPFILVKNEQLKHDAVLIRHETIHLKQAAELLVLPFYLLYLLNYLINLIIYSNRHKAYRQVVFEREAYQNEHNATYLNKRKLWAWFKCFAN